MAGLGAALVGGAATDGWAHSHVPQLETFFTPWHALLYSAVLANGTVLFMRWLLNIRRGVPARRGLPPGYGLSLVGAAGFGVGGVLDLAWHLAFGIEANFSAVMSPTHLLLMAVMALVVTGPLRAAWRRPTRRAGWPAVVSATLLLTVFSFWAEFALPVVNRRASSGASAAANFDGPELGVLGVVLASALLVGIVLPLVLRFQLPLGGLTVLVGGNAAILLGMIDFSPMVLVFLVGGAAGDLLLLALRPSADRGTALRVFAVALPLVTYAAYFGYLLATSGVSWPVHVWAGCVAVAGAVGLLLSLLVLPPAGPLRGQEASCSFSAGGT